MAGRGRIGRNSSPAEEVMIHRRKIFLAKTLARQTQVQFQPSLRIHSAMEVEETWSLTIRQ